MNQFFIGIILLLGVGGYFLYQENVTLKANAVIMESAIQEQQAAMKAIQENFEKQSAALQNLQRVNAEIEQEKAEYLKIFAKHNLNNLAQAKPGLLETRFNKASEAVFEGLEDDTQQIFELDTPVIPD
jgi:cell shape-determining protein MreC